MNQFNKLLFGLYKIFLGLYLGLLLVTRYETPGRYFGWFDALKHTKGGPVCAYISFIIFLFLNIVLLMEVYKFYNYKKEKEWFYSLRCFFLLLIPPITNTLFAVVLERVTGSNMTFLIPITVDNGIMNGIIILCFVAGVAHIFISPKYTLKYFLCKND